MTVREAFEKAGYPVTEGAKIVHYDNNGMWFWFKPPLLADWECGKWVADSMYQLKQHLIPACDDRTQDLSNLPAIDFYDALPAVIQKAVKR